MVIYDSVAHVNIWPDFIQQILSREYTPTAANERGEQLQLFRCRIQSLTVAPKFEPHEIQYAVAESKLFLLHCYSATKSGPDSCPKLPKAKWFGHVVIGPRIQSQNLLRFSSLRGEHD